MPLPQKYWEFGQPQYSAADDWPVAQTVTDGMFCPIVKAATCVSTSTVNDHRATATVATILGAANCVRPLHAPFTYLSNTQQEQARGY